MVSEPYVTLGSDVVLRADTGERPVPLAGGGAGYALIDGAVLRYQDESVERLDGNGDTVWSRPGRPFGWGGDDSLVPLTGDSRFSESTATGLVLVAPDDSTLAAVDLDTGEQMPGSFVLAYDAARRR